MENSNSSGGAGGGRHGDHLGVNNQSHKIGKGNVRKSPLHQPSFGNPRQQQPQPQVYNISKNDFRNIVQQLTGSPAPPDRPTPPPPVQPPKPPSMRLQKIRPPPLMPINRPHAMMQPPPAMMPRGGPGYGGPMLHPSMMNNTMYNHNPNPLMMNRPSNPSMIPSPSFSPLPPLTPGDAVWANHVAAESPVSAYVRILQSTMMDAAPRPVHHPPGLLPTPQQSGHPMQLHNPPLLPSPTSQFLLPSPTGFMHFPSPRSPFPLLSPTHLPSPSQFSFPSPTQPGILGPGPIPQLPPLSPGFMFPLSPGARFPALSPRWRDQ